MSTELITLWQPIETAPTDNAKPLYLACLDDSGNLIDIDFDGAWESDRESLEIPTVYYYWCGTKGLMEPTHWAYQIGSPPSSVAKPIDMILHCPACGTQHIDAPTQCHAEMCEGGCVQPADCNAWRNPPHRSHLCASCGHIWRPADVPTNGVQAIATRGKDDSEPGGIPDGWVMHTADFSINAATPTQPGSVMLVRDPMGRKAWHALPEDQRTIVELYVYGFGLTLRSALQNACNKAAALPTVAVN